MELWEKHQTRMSRLSGFRAVAAVGGLVAGVAAAAQYAGAADLPSRVYARVSSPILNMQYPAGKPGTPLRRGLPVASRHILVKLMGEADSPAFLKAAQGKGLGFLGRVYGSNWMTLSIPEGESPRAAAATAYALPGVLRATPDPIVRINDQIPPRDLLYIDDDNPSTKDCDPFVEICETVDLVDQWGLFQVSAETAWTEQLGSADVVIAVLDSGLDLDHDDLWGNLWINPGEVAGNGIDDDGNGLIDDVHGADFCGDNVGRLDDNPASQDGDPDIPTGGQWLNDANALPYQLRFDGDPAVGDAVDNNADGLIDAGVTHGTLVAGIAAAMTDNLNPDTGEFEGMAGVCWHCRVMPVRMINAEGWAYGSDAAAAVRYAADMGARVINASWGIDLDEASPGELAETLIMVDAIDYAVAKGAIVVAASGNTGTGRLHFPAALPNTLAVGSSDWLDRRSAFSSYADPLEIPDNDIDDDGDGWTDNVLDLVAPGEFIWSTYVLSADEALLYDFLGLIGWEPGSDTYGTADGTSFSAPLVSGYVGLLLSHNPGAGLSQVRDLLRAKATDLFDPNDMGENLAGYDPYSGFGRLNLWVESLAVQVRPTTGLITTEAGGTQVVGVVLGWEPGDAVSFPVATDDSTEVAVSPPSLTFSAADWDLVQWVTLTGLDDGEPDGDRPFSLLLGPVSTGDPTFAAAELPEVRGRNLDDECGGESHVTVDNRIFPVGLPVTCTASASLDTDGLVVVGEAADATFLSPQIVLNPGFRVDEGGSFRAATATVSTVLSN